MELPEEYVDVMITYRESHSKLTATKRGFYSESFGNFSIPPGWARFNGVLLPNGWGGIRLTADKVIKWEYCKDQ